MRGTALETHAQDMSANAYSSPTTLQRGLHPSHLTYQWQQPSSAASSAAERGSKRGKFTVCSPDIQACRPTIIPVKGLHACIVAGTLIGHRHQVCLIDQKHRVTLVLKISHRKDKTRIDFNHPASFTLAIGEMQINYKAHHFFRPFFFFVTGCILFTDTLLSISFGCAVVSLSW